MILRLADARSVGCLSKKKSQVKSSQTLARTARPHGCSEPVPACPRPRYIDRRASCRAAQASGHGIGRTECSSITTASETGRKSIFAQRRKGHRARGAGPAQMRSFGPKDFACTGTGPHRHSAAALAPIEPHNHCAAVHRCTPTSWVRAVSCKTSCCTAVQSCQL